MAPAFGGRRRTPPRSTRSTPATSTHSRGGARGPAPDGAHRRPPGSVRAIVGSAPMPDGRFAPSPTGPLHVGNLRTALLAWLVARVDGGRFLIRVEDLDPVASRAELVAEHLEDMAALGLDHDGPVVRQSDPDVRARHEDAIAALAADGALYPCFCSRREIREAAHAAHGPLPEGAYPGTCRRSEEHTSELQSLMRISYAVFCLKKKKKKKPHTITTDQTTSQ